MGRDVSTTLDTREMKENEVFSPSPLFRLNEVNGEISHSYQYQNNKVYTVR